MRVPGVWSFALLSLAAFRVWRVIAEDTVLDRPREWVTTRTEKPWIDEFILCPWCAGFWISLAWWLAWVAWPHWTLVVAVPFAISAVVALIAVNLDPD